MSDFKWPMPDEFPPFELSKRLNRLMEERGWTQHQCAEAGQVHAADVWAVAAGERLPSSKWIENFAANVGISVKDLTGWDAEWLRWGLALTRSRTKRALVERDWSRCTTSEIASVLGVGDQTIVSNIKTLRREFDFIVKYHKPGRFSYANKQLAHWMDKDTGRVYAHGACRQCDWGQPVSDGYVLCSYNVDHWATGEKHGPIDLRAGGCDKITSSGRKK